MNHSKVWIFIVLVSFVGLILPKDLWHHCDGMHLNEDQQDQKTTHFSKDTTCTICDFHFFPAVENNFTQFVFSRLNYPILELLLHDFNLILEVHSFLRGPPKV